MEKVFPDDIIQIIGSHDQLHSKPRMFHHDIASNDLVANAMDADDTAWNHNNCVDRKTQQRSFPAEQSMTKFRVCFNIILYCIGSILFVIGSIFYYPFANQDPNQDGFTFGAILYLIGASLFFIAALVEWILLQWRRQRIVLDYSVLYIVGSAQYVIGCIYYIPVSDAADTGSYLFILGSIFFTVSAIYEIYLSAKHIKYNMKTIKILTLIPLQIATAINTASGAILFAIGAVLFLHIENDQDLNLATSVFVSGSVLFTISSVLFSIDLFRKEWPIHINP